MTADTPRVSLAPPRALTIAGSDSGAGAGIQADLKTFAALGVYGTTAITAVTAQNTRTVAGAEELSVGIIAAQIDAVMDDIGADAAKTGMLSSAAIIETVAERIRRHGIRPLVVDPVMVAKSGHRLLREDAVTALKLHLLPLATIVTPNVPEAEVLSDITIDGEAALAEAARRIAALGPRYVLIKGGHLPGEIVVDRLWDATTEQMRQIESPRLHTTSTHGTGCTLSAAIAAHLALGKDMPSAVAAACSYVAMAIGNAQSIGGGHGPLNHFWASGQPAHPPASHRE